MRMPSPKRFDQDERLALNDLRCYRCRPRSCHTGLARCESVWTGTRSKACAKHQALTQCDSHQVQKIWEELVRDNSQRQRCSTHWSLDSEDQEVWDQILCKLKDSLVTNFVLSCLTLPVEMAAVKVEAVGGVLVRTAAGIFTDQLHD